MGDRSAHERRSEAGTGHRGVGWHRQGLRRELHAAGWAVTGASRRGGRAGLLAKRLLPFRAFEAAAKSSLGV